MNSRSSMKKSVFALVGAAALVLPLAACSAGDGGDGGTTISFLTQNSDQNIASAEALIAAFEAENPDISVNLETQPAGTEGDNLMKTKLSTDEMDDVFYYNSGSLLQALNPDQYLVNLSDEAWVADLTDDMKTVVSTENGLYGAPFGTSQAGAVLYNKPIYEQLGLSVPTSWSEFAANNDAISAAGIPAIIQTYGDTWTSQLFVLGDFGNVLAQDPDWAEKYTAGERKYADEPGLQAFDNQEEAGKAGWFNPNFASALYDDGVRMVATGEGAQYPILTGAVSAIAQNYADNVDDVGVFAFPAQDAADTKLTVWLPNAMYIPKTTEGAELEASKKFIAFANSAEGCEIQTSVLSVSGPFATSACSLPDDVPALVQDLQVYFDEGNTNPALEFLSPIKGPNLENITVEVGSGIRSAADGAALYDDDVKKQAQQLGLDGW
ncbi:ABC transporter substrate-binding protein [Agromyces atrinae]|uniref:Carbohydrate ABC transporter substrate-binding protein n=1 Tax=Agromyces atrinae TaxID=592376 RepID=A0A4Q2MDV1_9MICO|nr:ABC transporter substrate-binding protein [Agromyces atrinae]NYD67533.1 raffinose/stachyose/melibiose transport system substrate-binding protein [Agromyces atrinae]RXZ88252.1 carbohydrate ABC transporter substrate-binding protein [Agromyces atrinae]